MTSDASQARRVEIILQQLEALPTLHTVAMRVLQLTTQEDSRSEEIIHLIASDPSLASKVLKLSRTIDPARAERITTVERAVLHLGFDAVRSAVLSVQIFDYFNSLREIETETVTGRTVFDREAFWHHSLATAVLSETLARSGPMRNEFDRGEAFLAGLLHDLGLLALHALLPKSVDRVCRFAESNGLSLDQACAQLIGINARTAGKRLAERWKLPRALGDVMWLNGQRLVTVPDLNHKRLIGLVTLADAIARARYIAPVGHIHRGEPMDAMAEELGLTKQMLHHAVDRLPTEVAERANSLGMNVAPDAHLLLQSMTRANDSLGRINAALRRRAMLAQRQEESLQAIIRFQQSLAPGDSVFTVFEKVTQSAREFFGGGFYAVLYEGNPATGPKGRAGRGPWQLVQFGETGRVVRNELIVPPADAVDLSTLNDSDRISIQTMAILPWLTDYLTDTEDIRNVSLLPLRCGWGVSAVLLSDQLNEGGEHHRQQTEALSSTWAAAIAAGIQHEGARALGEQLAEANRSLLETQDELTRSQALAALGEIVAGAAHEMNNPLTLICGRAQQLADELEPDEQRKMADQIVTQSHRLSDMITTLRQFTEPTSPVRRAVDLNELVMRIVQRFKPTGRQTHKIDTILPRDLPPVVVDPEQMAAAISELVKNAVEAREVAHIEVRVQIDPEDDRLKVQVRDDGSGLSNHALAHAFDPFFSEKSAGRQPGLGLSQARRFVEAHGGRITLENGLHGGAVATIRLPEWRQVPKSERRVA